MKKGFTLIELLAVIVILGVIGLITVPAYLNAITAQREKAFLESEKGIIRGTINYLNFNPDLYPKEIDDINTITFQTLQEEKMIGTVKNVSGDTCSGSVTVTKTTENEYSYDLNYICD